ncbi:hypothetical protein C8F01DRAFT_1178633 [Mycena amicta]|nr:hypothetical protein C8F01DRAFT_1178633 [Mycena amicta]
MSDFIVDIQPGNFASFLKAGRFFAKGETLTFLDKATHSRKAYSTVQCGRDANDNIELNCDFVYVNHSCEPNVVFDLSDKDRTKWQVRAVQDIETGSPITFFYPSTEWEMEQPFDCQCGSANCLKRVLGAKYLTRETVCSRGFCNSWIIELMAERE